MISETDGHSSLMAQGRFKKDNAVHSRPSPVARKMELMDATTTPDNWLTRLILICVHIYPNPIERFMVVNECHKSVLASRTIPRTFPNSDGVLRSKRNGSGVALTFN